MAPSGGWASAVTNETPAGLSDTWLLSESLLKLLRAELTRWESRD